MDIDAVQFFVGRNQFFIGRLQFLIACFQLLNSGLKIFA